MVEVSVYFNRAHTGPACTTPVGPSGFCKPYISVTVRVIILKWNLTNTHFSIIKRIKFLKQLTESSEHDIYSNSKNLQRLLEKINFCEWYISETIIATSLKQKLKVIKSCELNNIRFSMKWTCATIETSKLYIKISFLFNF